MNSPRDLLKGLLEYIEEQAKVIDPKGYRVSTAKGFLRRHTDLVGLPGLEYDLRPNGDHIWLLLARLEPNSPPRVPELINGLTKNVDDPFASSPILDESRLGNWINQRQSALTPALEPQIDGKQQAEELRRQANNALQQYVPQWEAWAAGERPRRTSITLYGDLFALKHQIEAEETANPQEFVWGVGMATWQIPFGESRINFEYPLLTQTVEIFIDESSMAIGVRPRDTTTRVELDAFVACSVLGSADVERAAKEQLERLNNRSVTPFDASTYTDVLKLIASNLDSNGTFREVLVSGEPTLAPGKDLIVSDAWILHSRPRSTHYLIEDLKRLKDKLVEGCDIPIGPVALVTPPSDQPIEYDSVNFRGLSSRGSNTGKIEELYFPLPYNQEQVTIVQRLERAAGVAVQGPPGTGKTHTIANVICHYLATGRRVLVTSRGEPALAVLQSKIPEEVRALTVSLMASDREGIRQFQASIEAIQHQVSQLNPEQTRSDIATLQSAIDRAHQELSFIDARIDTIAETQLSEVEVDGIPMRAQKLAELVTTGEQKYGWFIDDVTLNNHHSPPLTEEEAGFLREARRKLGQDLEYVTADLPSADSLLNVTAIAELHATLCSMRNIDEEITRGDVLDLKATTAEVLVAARNLLDLVENARTLVEDLESSASEWPLELRVKCRLATFASERLALESLFSNINSLIAARAEFLKRPVEFPEAGLGSARTLEAVRRAVDTGKPFGPIALRASDAKSHIAGIRVSGLPPSSVEDWIHIQRYVDLHVEVISFISRWNQFAEELSMPRLEGGVSALRQFEMTATLAKKAHQLATEFDAVLPKKAEAVFRTVPAKELAGSSAELGEVMSHLQRHLTKADLSKASAQLSTLQEKLAGKTGSVSIALKRFVEDQLGNPSIAADRATTTYIELITEVRRIAALTNELSNIKEFVARIEQAGAPKLASRVLSLPVESTGEDVVFPVSWRNAWNWARVRTYLDSIEARSELISLSTKRRDLEAGLSRLYKELVSKAAWLATKRNATPKVLQALAGYATAIRRIGQGTGPNATRYRKDAREAMLDAAGAVPCWIMSHARISESMPPDFGAFDLVIVDEASQSDLWALPAILRGKKILVVGDDKQVSPDGGFIAGQRIQELKTRFLNEQPYGTEMTPEKSLYDLAARVFAAEQVMLREHFRCVPHIIAYSNRMFYKGGIQPLRIPKSNERIEPPLVDIYVPDGYRNKHDQNDYEAKVIAEEISAILMNETLKDKTIGVVSLLGMEQAKYIDSVVRRRCDAAELYRRQFESGEARTFQGSERDIIFLSMVADRKNCHALSGLKFDQRFNVAASRARDRMYLVRSVNVSDLSDKDLRHTLLSHFNNPQVTDAEETELLLDRCESGFEREVFTLLCSLGYRVTPQVKTGAYRIDMVVEGEGDSRLAIELDGDEYHGPDRWQQDMNRQRVLERAGWEFWRCFASTWSLRKDEILQELLARLTAMGIEPTGAILHAPSVVEKRTWQITPVANSEPILDGSQAALEFAISDAQNG